MKAELLAPAGNAEKLRHALYFGADAVYLGGKQFSLRSFADNFTEEELAEAVAYAHARGKKVYVAANIFARNSDLPALERYFCLLEELGADGVLVSDAGVFGLARKHAPHVPVHISTQANTTNAAAAKFWQSLGAKRIVLARELSAAEISEIHAACPDLELEAFVHGAMCLSYSGRCYLSDYLDGRSSNRGACTQPCRDEYTIASAKSGPMTVEEDGRGTYLLNSKDLALIRRLEELAAAGVVSFKIEGRMKSEFYLGTVVGAYRRAIDGEPSFEELLTLTHREYTEGFAFPSEGSISLSKESQVAGTCEFVAIVRGYEKGRAAVEMRSRFFEGETLELLTPSPRLGEKIKVEGLRAPTGEECGDAKLVQGLYTFSCPVPLSAGDMLRRRK